MNVRLQRTAVYNRVSG